MSDEPRFENEGNIARTQVLPAFEIIKRDILFSWFNIEAQYQEYLRQVMMGKDYRIEKLASMIMSLHFSILKPMMEKERFKDDFSKFLEEMNQYRKTKNIPLTDIDYVVDMFSKFLHILKLSDITFESKTWEERFEESYGI
jgi:hypothetical protein